MATKIKIELPIILPCALDREDQCIDHLLEIVQYYRGVDRAHVDRQQEGIYLCVHYNPDFFTPEKIQKIIELAGAKVKIRYRHEIVKVERMDCRICADVIEHSLSRMDGILSAAVNYEAERIRIDYDSAAISRKQIEERLRLLGYTVIREEVPRPWFSKHRELTLSIICGIFFLLGSLLFYLWSRTALLTFGIFIICYVAGGYYAAHDTVRTLLKRRFDIEFLMLLAAVGAAILGKWQEGALLLFLFSLGHALEHLAMDKARENIRALGKITPKEALVLREGQEKNLPIKDLLRGDMVIVKPGERIPADGTVTEGHSFVDQSPITGEYIPVEKGLRDAVFAGTINGNGVLKVEVTKLSKESTIARVLQLIEDAQTQKSRSQRFSERFEHILVPIVLSMVLLMIAVPFVIGKNPADSIYKALAILVAASPCALAIATPSAVLAGIARAAKEGVLIKGGIHLENIGSLSAMAFDKTGTITEGKPRLVGIYPAAPFGEDELLQVSASVECSSGHPLAAPILAAAEERKLTLVCTEEAELLTGRGITARYQGEKVYIGKLSLFADKEVPGEIAETVAKSEASGYTAILVKKGNRFMGVLALQDRPRLNARLALDGLKTLKIKPLIMITGDHARSAQGIADMVGIDEVRAELLPEEKVKAISEYAQKYRYIAMVGDGINDAPAMAHSTIGIAMGSAGTDIAMETADVALMADNLLKLPFTVALGRTVSKVIRQNLLIALGIIAILILSVMTGWVGISVAVIAHEGSTLLVVLNALGILAFKDRFSSKLPSAGE